VEEGLKGGDFDWQKRHFILDPYSQVLREYLGSVSVLRMNVRHAVIKNVSQLENRHHTFAIQGLTATILCSAADGENYTAWVDALEAASGVTPPAPPATRSTAVIVACLVLVLVIAAVALGLMFGLGLLGSAPSLHPLHNWTQCQDMQAACESCDCFVRCIYASTLGLQMPVLNRPHLCGLACNCQVRAPVTSCGDGRRMDYTVDWYGTSIHVHEECDDGNTVDGDGCDAKCATESFMATFALAQRVQGLATSRSLCGRGHTLSDCETSCKLDASCQSIWYGGGWCHIFSQISPLVASQAARGRGSAIVASDWDEMEYACGEGKFVAAPALLQIRASVVLFGQQDFNNHSHANVFREIFEEQPFCDASCSLNLLSTLSGTLPFGDSSSTRCVAVAV